MLAVSANNEGDVNGNIVVIGFEGLFGGHVWVPTWPSASITSRGNARYLGSSPLSPFRSGTRPNRQDAAVFAAYIMLQSDIDMRTRLAASAVVTYNGIAWESQP